MGCGRSFGWMNAVIPSRRVLMSLAAASFAMVFAAFYFLERNNLGIAHFYYVPIALAALAGGAWVGGAAGLVATGLYAAAIVYSPRIPAANAPTLQTGLRGVTFVLMGLLIGWFATLTRKQHNELTVLAERDRLTGLPNTRAFEKAIAAHLAAGGQFALLVAHVEELAIEGGASERTLRTVGDTLAAAARPSDEVARISDSEFAVLQLTGDQREAAEYFERVLFGAGVTATLGWASFPEDGDNALSLYRAADERLYARKVFRGYASSGVERLRVATPTSGRESRESRV